MNLQRYIQTLSRIEEICKLKGPKKRAELEGMKQYGGSLKDISKKNNELQKLREECAEFCADAASMSPRRFRLFWSNLLHDVREAKEGRARDREMYRRMWREPMNLK